MNNFWSNWPAGKWSITALMVTLVTVWAFFASTAQAAPDTGSQSLTVLPDQQIFNDDFTINPGEILDDNVVVFRGDVEIEEEGRLNGNLSVFGGDVTIRGRLDGELSVVGGDLELEKTAQVNGNVSVLGGSIERDAEAVINGTIVGGPNSEVLPEEMVPDGFGEGISGDRIRTEMARDAGSSPLLRFFFRLIRAFLLTMLLTGLVTLIDRLFPKPIDAISETYEKELPLNFAVGSVVSIAALGLGAIFGITIILICLSVLLMAALSLLGLTGLTVSATWLARRVEASMGNSRKILHPILPVTLAAFVLSGIVFLDWAISACLGLAVGVVIFSPGVGAVLVHQARRTGFTGNQGQTQPQNHQPGSPTVAYEPAPSKSAAKADIVEASVAETVAEPSVIEPDEDEAKLSQTAPEQDEGADATDADAPSQEETGQIQEPFTQIRGIGPAFQQRLYDAGIVTFRQLAELTPEEISAILGWSAERIIRDKIREQAAKLAEDS